MKKGLLLVAAVVWGVGFSAGPARAATLSLLPPEARVAPGERAELTLGYEGIRLGAFSLDILVEAEDGGLGAPDVEFGPYLGIPDTDYSAAVSAPFETDIVVEWSQAGPSLGTLHLEQLSLLSSGELAAIPPPADGRYALAALGFPAPTGRGRTTPLTLQHVVLSAVAGTQIADITLGHAVISAVPEPPPLGLLAVGLLLLLYGPRGRRTGPPQQRAKTP
jgi:hypothetical protein